MYVSEIFCENSGTISFECRTQLCNNLHMFARMSFIYQIAQRDLIFQILSTLPDKHMSYSCWALVVK
jgi:hypothetical protein